MAAGNRNAKGRPTDIVFHYGAAAFSPGYCGQKAPGVVTGLDFSTGPVTCRRCIAKMKRNRIPMVLAESP